MKILLKFIVVVLFVSTNCCAQENAAYLNTIQFNSGEFYIPKVIYYGHRLPYDEIGFSFSRQLIKHFGIDVSYSFWNNSNSHKTSSGTSDYFVSVEPTNSSIEHGTMHGRQGYHFFEIGPNCQLKVNENNSFKAGIGYCHLWGANEYYDYVSLNPYPPYDIMYSFSISDITYNGIYANISYNYIFLRKRLNVGPELKLREFFNSFSQYNIGIHFGFNF